MAIGIFINSLAWVPFALVQGAGRPDLTAKLHLSELPLYLLTLWCLIKGFGLEGAALAWVLRVVLDAILLFYLAQRLLPASVLLLQRLVVPVGLALMALAIAALLVGPVMKGFFLALTSLGFIPAAWFHILSPEERARVKSHLRPLSASNGTT